jgi:hypothetical protein
MDIHVYFHDSLSALLLERAVKRLEHHMTAQTDRLIADVTALINEATTDIAAAIARAQNQSPDPAIDALDGQVTAATQKLKDAMATLQPNAPGAPAPSTPGL